MPPWAPLNGDERSAGGVVHAFERTEHELAASRLYEFDDSLSAVYSQMLMAESLPFSSCVIAAWLSAILVDHDDGIAPVMNANGRLISRA